MARVDKPVVRRVNIIVTGEEWRALRVAAAQHDTSIQGYITNTVLRRLRRDGQLKREAGSSHPPGGSAPEGP